MRDLTLLLSFSVKYRPADDITVDKTAIESITESRKLLYKEVNYLIKEVRQVQSRSFLQTFKYSGDPKADPSKTGNIWKPDFLKIGFQMVLP